MQWMELRPLLHFGVEAIEKGAYGSPSTEDADFTFKCSQELSSY